MNNNEITNGIAESFFILPPHFLVVCLFSNEDISPGMQFTLRCKEK